MQVWLRPTFSSSPAITTTLHATLDLTGSTPSSIDLFDFYSCFPVVPKLACLHLGMNISEANRKAITVLGGLTSFGGAGNNYSMHAITEMTRQLRAGKGTNGLVMANGGFLTYQYVVCLSRNPRSTPYPEKNPLPDHLDTPAPEVVEEANGEAVVETYTVDWGRKGEPTKAHIVGRLKGSGERFLANEADERTLRVLAEGGREPIGMVGVVRGDPEEEGRNLFEVGEAARL